MARQSHNQKSQKEREKPKWFTGNQGYKASVLCKEMQRKGSHRRPKFREKLIHRGDQRSNQSSLPGNQDKHGGRNRRMLENKVKKKKKKGKKAAHRWERAMKC